MTGLRIAIIGSRGIPAHYGGFESFAEELAPGLVERGHEVTVYCRRGYTGTDEPETFKGVRLRYTPYLRRRSLETFSHELSSILDSLRRPFDVYYFLGTRGSPLYVPLRWSRRKIVVHTDGLEWMRRKWSPAGRRYLRLAESIAARRASDALVTDGGAMRTYYLDRYGRDSRHISYGARIVEKADSGTLDRWNLKTGRYLLAVGRLEPENNLDVIVREFLRSGSKRELLIVGGAPYDTAFVRGLRAMERPGSVRFLGPVYDANFLENLYAGAFACVHGHEVGGTNPSLVRAMGAGASVLALDTRFNRETLGGAGVLWSAKEGELASALSELEGDPSRARELGEMARTRASTEFTWESVIRRHEELFRDLAEARKGTGDSR